MDNDLKSRIMLISIILLLTLVLATGYYAFSLREKYNIKNNT